MIPEIKEKIADTKDMQNETVKKLGDKASEQSERTQEGVSAKSSTAELNAFSSGKRSFEHR